MNRHCIRPSTTCALTGLLGGLFALTASALAAPPQIAYLEKAQTQASESQVRSHGVPTTDSTGKLLYWDVTIELGIDPAGKPNPSATVTSIKQVKVSSTRLVAGQYKDTFGAACNVTTGTLPSGRQEGAISCVNGGYYWNASVISGSIPGHPFEIQLAAAGIGDISGYRDYLWGLTGTSSYVTCFSTNHIASARQIGTKIVVSFYGGGNTAQCALTLTKAP